MIGVPLALLLLVPADEKPIPKLPLGKETTYITEPLDKDGYLDYETALNDRLGKGITPEKNANVLLWKALGPSPERDAVPDEVFKRLGIDRPPENGDYFIGLTAYLKDRAKLDRKEFAGIEEQQWLARKRPWSAKDYPHLAGWLKANEKPLAVVIEATRRPNYYNPLATRSTPTGRTGLAVARIPSAQQCREVGVALAVRATLRLKEGKLDDAWQDLLACHRLGRLVARGGSLLEPLIGVAIDQIASTADLAYLDRAGLTAKQAAACLKDLRDLPPMPPLADNFDLSERFIFLDSVQFVRRYGLESLRDHAFEPPAKPDAKEVKALAVLDWEPTLRDANRLFDRTASALRVEDRAKREKELDRIDEDIRKRREAAEREATSAGGLLKSLLGGRQVNKTVGDMLTSLLFPPFRKIQYARERVEQAQRNLAVAFALAAYRADRGRYPEKLDDLTPKYLPAVPGDLLSGKALIYRPEEKGYLLYSVGVNGKDEGGRWTDDDPPGDDIRVRMPLPEAKRQK